MGLTRRAFFKQTASLLTALGLSDTALTLLGHRYQSVLAHPTRRKLALLVGINQYPESVCDCSLSRGSALNGCLTDVELQRELLVHRFGFQSSDILALTDQFATRQTIEDAFRSHLIEQARPGDVVVFHFSGLGSLVQWGDEADRSYSLVPVDGILPTEQKPVIQDLVIETLALLLRALPTQQVTTVLDVGYTNLGKILQGNLRLRSRPSVPSGQLAEPEQALHDQLMSQLQVSLPQIRSQWRSGQVPGTVLAAAQPNQIATEGQWNGFSAGLFTYALTQQLWWTTPATTLRVNLNQVVGTVKQLAGTEQQPSLTGQNQSQELAYHVAPFEVDADGVVQALDEDGRAYVWFAGLPTAVLENYGASILETVMTGPDDAVQSTLLQVRGRDGLLLKARPLDGTQSPPQVHQLVRERVRVLPRNIGLTVAIDASLERIERVDATSAFAAIARVSSVIAGEPADFLFGKVEPNAATLTAALPNPSDRPASLGLQSAAALKGGYGLFSLGRDAIPNTLIREDEAVKKAVNRVTPQLRNLLAIKLLRLTANRGSSQLGVRATLETVAPQERILMQQSTTRFSIESPEPKPRTLTDLFATDGAISLPVGCHLRYRLENVDDRPLYFMLLGLDTNGDAIAFTSGADNRVVAAGDTITLPSYNAEWVEQLPTGVAEMHLVCSRAPFTQAYQALQTSSKTDARPIVRMDDPLNVVQMLLQDLQQASLPVLPPMDIPTDTYALSVDAWATLSFVYQVVAS